MKGILITIKIESEGLCDLKRKKNTIKVFETKTFDKHIQEEFVGALP